MVKIYEIAHFLRQVTPFLSVSHHVLTTPSVVVLHRDILLRILIVDISLRNAQFLFHAKLHGQPMGVPARFAVNLKSLHRLIPVEGVLYGSCQHMVNARMAVGRGRSLIENELRASLPFSDTPVEHIFRVPFFQYLLVGLIQVQTVMFGKFPSHIYFYFNLVVCSLFNYRAQNYKKNM